MCFCTILNSILWKLLINLRYKLCVRSHSQIHLQNKFKEYETIIKVNSCLFVCILIQVTAVLIKLSSQYRLKNSFVHCDHLIFHFYLILYNCEKCLPQF